jgi:signal transduction histidine kinase
MTTADARAQWQDWGPDVAGGAAVAAVGVFEALTAGSYTDTRQDQLVVALGIGVAVALARRLPSVALATVWLVGLAQVVGNVSIMLVELSIALVAFACARWGSTATVWLSGLSIPAAAFLAVGYVDHEGLGSLSRFIGTGAALDAARRVGTSWPLVAGAFGFALLAVPWLAGVAVRNGARATRSRESQVAAEADTARAQRETEQAREIAALREGQARLARDVHDVVGHSLAVILAQAESAQYLPDDDTAALKRTMATIADSARSSLQDVRQVLAGPQAPPPPQRTGAFEALIEGVRASGHEVAATESGTPQPLPPELDLVAHRVTQEMLTNAIKHGRNDRPVIVERHWPQNSWERDLRIEVRNAVMAVTLADETQPIATVVPPGQGVEGMRRRLESVGGRLDVRHREEPSGPTFTATAWVPVSSR